MTDRTLQRTKERETKGLLEHARRMLRFDALTGKLWWRTKPSGAADAGDEAGYIMSKGYRVVKVKGDDVLAHRLIWALQYGEWPAGMLDHRNAIKDDNRVDNLRDASRSDNAANRAGWGSKNGGYKGVTRKPQRTGGYRFQAAIQRAGKRVTLGCFETAEEAGQAYKEAAAQTHGAFALAAREEALREI